MRRGRNPADSQKGGHPENVIRQRRGCLLSPIGRIRSPRGRPRMRTRRPFSGRNPSSRSSARRMHATRPTIGLRPELLTCLTLEVTALGAAAHTSESGNVEIPLLELRLADGNSRQLCLHLNSEPAVQEMPCFTGHVGSRSGVLASEGPWPGRNARRGTPARCWTRTVEGASSRRASCVRPWRPCCRLLRAPACRGCEECRGRPGTPDHATGG